MTLSLDDTQTDHVDSRLDVKLTSLLNDNNTNEEISMAKLKIDELLFQFLSLEENEKLVQSLVQDYEAGLELPDEVASQTTLSSPVFSPRQRASPSPPRSPRSPRQSSFSPRSPSFPSPQKSLQNSIGFTNNNNNNNNNNNTRVSKHQQQKNTDKKYEIPKFYQVVDKVDKSLMDDEIERYFKGYEENGIPMNDFVILCKNLCGFPTFFNGPLVRRILLIWKTTKKVQKYH